MNNQRNPTRMGGAWTCPDPDQPVVGTVNKTRGVYTPTRSTTPTDYDTTVMLFPGEISADEARATIEGYTFFPNHENSNRS